MDQVSHYTTNFHTTDNLHALTGSHGEQAAAAAAGRRAGRQASRSSSSTKLHSSSVCCTTTLHQSRSYKSSGIVQPEWCRLLADTNNLVCCAIPPRDPPLTFLTCHLPCLLSSRHIVLKVQKYLDVWASRLSLLWTLPTPQTILGCWIGLGTVIGEVFGHTNGLRSKCLQVQPVIC